MQLHIAVLESVSQRVNGCKSRDFNFEIDDLNNDGITSNILNNEFHQNFLGEGRIYDERLRLKMMRLM